MSIWKTGGYVRNVRSKLGFEPTIGNVDQHHREVTATTIAAISRGNDGSNNPTKRYGRLLREAALDMSCDIIKLSTGEGRLEKSPGRPLEFVPVVIDYSIVEDGRFVQLKIGDMDSTIPMVCFLDLCKFSYVSGMKLYTNLRNVLKNVADSYTCEDHTLPKGNAKYLVYEVEAPYYVFAQMRTHSRLSQVAVSERVVTEDKYWLPDDIMEKVISSEATDVEYILEFITNVRYGYSKNIPIEINVEDGSLLWMTGVGENGCAKMLESEKAELLKSIVNDFLAFKTTLQVQEILKYLGYPKEIINRWPNHVKYKRWIIGGWSNDPLAWGHLLLEREAFPELHTSWVQKETGEVAVALKEAIQKDYPDIL